MSDGSAQFVVVAATLFVYTRHRQSPANVPRFLSLIWCEMCLLSSERAMCERKAKKDVPAAVVSGAACVSRASLDDASRPALAGWGRSASSLRVNLLSTIFVGPLHNRCLYSVVACFQLAVFCKPTLECAVQNVYRDCKHESRPAQSGNESCHSAPCRK